MKLLFDIGANRGDATAIGLEQGYKVVALEPAPRIFKQLITNFLYNPMAIPLKFAVSDSDDIQIEFYEADEDGLSTMNLDWLTSDQMPYNGKAFRTIQATTITIDSLVRLYGVPDLMKIDVEGAEWAVFRGMTKKYGRLTFEWTINTIKEHQKQLDYLSTLGYTEFSLQYIEEHLKEPDASTWRDISQKDGLIDEWNCTRDAWEGGGWKTANLRPTADVGMLWAR
jgi:FkbM family methyltransferase